MIAFLPRVKDRFFQPSKQPNYPAFYFIQTTCKKKACKSIQAFKYLKIRKFNAHYAVCCAEQIVVAPV